MVMNDEKSLHQTHYYTVARGDWLALRSSKEQGGEGTQKCGMRKVPHSPLRDTLSRWVDLSRLAAVVSGSIKE